MCFIVMLCIVISAVDAEMLVFGPHAVSSALLDAQSLGGFRVGSYFMVSYQAVFC